MLQRLALEDKGWPMQSVQHCERWHQMTAELLSLTAPNTHVRFQGALLAHVCLLDACLCLCEQKKLCNHLVLSMIREAPASPGSFPCLRHPAERILLQFTSTLSLTCPASSLPDCWSCTSFSYGSRSAPISSTVVLSCFHRSLACDGACFREPLTPHVNILSGNVEWPAALPSPGMQAFFLLVCTC